MSLHKKYAHLADLNEALKQHNLPHDKPSQPADFFRSGWLAAKSCHEEQPPQYTGLNSIKEPGWICTHPDYGTWFISRASVAKDWARDQKDYYGTEHPAADDEAIETWLHEQIGWMEVAAYGKQLIKPDMSAFERRLMQQMARDTDYLTHGTSLTAVNPSDE